MKDHEIARIHNDLRDNARRFGDAQQLRARLVSVIAPLVNENRALKEALLDLYSEQNGPPLLRDEASWQAAMDKACKLLGG